MFAGRALAIATKHKKEEVIAPLLESELQVKCIVPTGLDTDQFGTFTGEVPRIHSPLDAARLKCQQAMDQLNCDLAVASEGSFGPHPHIPFSYANEELLLLIDKHNNLEIFASELSLETNFDSEEVKSIDQLFEFATRVGFPSHRLILRTDRESSSGIIKGIDSKADLEKQFMQLKATSTSVFVETDMRAMHNPTRQTVISKATAKLIEQIKSVCPVCGTPGFSVTDVIQGLICENCDNPTRSIRAVVYSCQRCNYQLERAAPHGKKFEDPMYCDICNP